MNVYRNSEGYYDPTAGEALGRIMREKHRKQDKYRRKVYVASKYKGDTDGNVKAAIGYAQVVIGKGYMPVVSHLMYPQILCDDDPEERRLGLSFGLALLRMCDEVWVFGEVSEGMALEIKEARRLQKKIRFIKETEI